MRGLQYRRIGRDSRGVGRNGIDTFVDRADNTAPFAVVESDARSPISEELEEIPEALVEMVDTFEDRADNIALAVVESDAMSPISEELEEIPEASRGRNGRHILIDRTDDYFGRVVEREEARQRLPEALSHQHQAPPMAATALCRRVCS